MVDRRSIRWTGVGAAMLLILAIGYIGLRVAAAGEHSATAGRSYGASQADMYRQLSTEQPTDDEILDWCRKGADLAADTPVWYATRVVRLGVLDRDRFTHGCFETYRAATR